MQARRLVRAMAHFSLIDHCAFLQLTYAQRDVSAMAWAATGRHGRRDPAAGPSVDCDNVSANSCI